MVILVLHTVMVHLQNLFAHDAYFWLDFSTAVCGFVATCLFFMGRYHGWFLTFIGSACGAVLFFLSGLYAQVGLHLFYVLSACYGCWHWYQHQDSQQHVLVKTKIEMKATLAGILLWIVIYALSVTYLLYFTADHLPYLDVAIAMVFMTAQLLSVYRYIYTWLAWLLGDLLCLYVYWHESIGVHFLLMLFYVPMALYGFYHWYCLSQQQSQMGEVS